MKNRILGMMLLGFVPGVALGGEGDISHLLCAGEESPGFMVHVILNKWSSRADGPNDSSGMALIYSGEGSEPLGGSFVERVNWGSKVPITYLKVEAHPGALFSGPSFSLRGLGDSGYTGTFQGKSGPRLHGATIPVRCSVWNE